MKRLTLLLLVLAACGDSAVAITAAPPLTVPTTAVATTLPATTANPATTVAATTAPATTTPSTTGPPTTEAYCPVTLPDEPLVVPDGYSTEPSFGVWYGTAGLWTVVDPDGGYQQRKAVFWSQNFPGGHVEEQPELAVTWRQLDGPGYHEAAAPGTNAYTAEDGWFMINGIDPDEPGCWMVSATYGEGTLSFVYSN